MNLPRRVRVEELISGRYAPGQRPVSWDDRRSGSDVIRTGENEIIHLASSGGQSSPAAGWELLLTKEVGDDSKAAKLHYYEWTLYGLSSSESPSSAQK